CVCRADVRLEDNRSIAAPAATPSGGRVAQRHDTTTRCRHLLQFAASEECDPLTIRRKEWRSRVVGSRKQRRSQLIESTDVQLRWLSRAFAGGEREYLPVRRQYGRSSDVSD